MTTRPRAVLKKTESIRILCAFLCLLAAFLSACSGGKSAQVPPRPAAPVTVAPVVQKAIPIQLDAIGNIEAYSTVSVKSQVGGELIRVYFQEGQGVRKGDPLFTIDPRPHETSLRQAEANLAKDRAQLENALNEARRYEELIKEGFVAREQYERIRTSATALESVVKADEALLEMARLQLKYCHIHSPITGIAGSLLVDEGNLIKANADTPMVVINQIQPINVSFSVPEAYLPEIKRYMSSGKIRVQAEVTKGDEHPAEGVLTFVDNTVDVGTGTIKLRATFENEEKRLWPGQFVNVAMILTTQQNALVIPSRSVQTAEKGQYVYVIKNDLTADSRPVSVIRTIGDEAVVENGLQPGDRVVTDGQLRLVPGAKVEIRNSAETSK